MVEDERILAYLKWVELYFGANDIAAEKKGSYWYLQRGFCFYRRDQAAEESVLEFLVELRRLASHCEFGQFLDW